METLYWTSSRNCCGGMGEGEGARSGDGGEGGGEGGGRGEGSRDWGTIVGRRGVSFLIRRVAGGPQV